MIYGKITVSYIKIPQQQLLRVTLRGNKHRSYTMLPRLQIIKNDKWWPNIIIISWVNSIVMHKEYYTMEWRYQNTDGALKVWGKMKKGSWQYYKNVIGINIAMIKA